MKELQKLVNKAIEILKKEKIGRKTLAEMLGVPEALGRKILDIAMWEISKTGTVEEIYEEYRKPRKWILDKNNRIGIISDIHFPFENSEIFLKVLSYLKDIKIKTLIINGDLVDFYQISTFVKDPRINDIQIALSKATSFFKEIREWFNGKIYFRLGNHEERMSKFLFTKAPQLLELEVLNYENLFKSVEFGINIVYPQDLLASQHFLIFHGHELELKNVKYVPERLMERYATNIIVSHFHSTQQRIKPVLTPAGEQLIGSWVIGCLCNRPYYAKFSTNFNNGFAIVEIDEQGYFEVRNCIIVDNKIVG